jgi:transcriptional regulator with XRE-family HTH domain
MTENGQTWASRELSQYRNDPEFELEALLLDINEQILERIDAIGWRRTDLARSLGVSKAFVTKILGGNANLTLATLVKLTNVLGLKVRLDLVPRHVVDLLELDFGQFEELPLSPPKFMSGVTEGEQIPLAA